MPRISRTPLSLTALLLAAFVSLSELLAAPAAAGEPVKLLCVRAEFEDAKIGIEYPLWRERIDAVFDQAEAYWTVDSYGVISGFETECTDVYQLPHSAQFMGGENVHKLFGAMSRLAAEGGWELDKYDHVVLSYPGVLNQPFGAAALPGKVWLPGKEPYGPGLIHELGHAFGVGHASAIEADGVAYPGEHREGRDGFFMMGSDGGVSPGSQRSRAPTNLPMKFKMGFVGPEYFTRVTKPGVYRIYEFDRESLPKRADRFPLTAIFRNGDKEFWITYAPALAELWADYGGETLTRGAIVHEVEKSITRVIDFTPGSRGAGNTADYHDVRDGALAIGATYTFPDSGLTLKPVKAGKNRRGGRWIEVRVFQQKQRGARR